MLTVIEQHTWDCVSVRSNILVKFEGSFSSQLELDSHIDSAVHLLLLFYFCSDVRHFPVIQVTLFTLCLTKEKGSENIIVLRLQNELLSLPPFS